MCVLILIIIHINKEGQGALIPQEECFEGQSYSSALIINEKKY